MREYWKQIQGDMFDFERFYAFMASAIQSQGEIRVCEVGVANGKSAIFLAEALQNNRRPFKLTMIDNLAYGGPNQLNEILSNVQKSGLAENIQILPFSSLDASCRFPDEYFNFVFLDSSHEYAMTKSEIQLWWKKILPNGFLAGHDYTSDENPGVRQAVDETIPIEFLKNQTTEKNYGVWYVKKTQGAFVRC